MGIPAGPSSGSPSGAGLVTVADAKIHLNILQTDTSHDAELQGFIDAMTPVVEFFTGPINSASFDEWYDGGHRFIQTRRRPLLAVTSVTEYIGSAAYALTHVTSPDLGSQYSFMWETTGLIIRRTAGGGTQPFAGGPASVHVLYTAGLAAIPPNVRLGALELIRDNYQGTQQPGRPEYGTNGNGIDDTIQNEGVTVAGVFVQPRIIELLQPKRRAPRIA